MANQDLEPQDFPASAITQLPYVDFLDLIKNQVPQIYQNAVNFMAILNSIAIIKQQIYDIIRSIVNIYNLYSSGNDNKNIATPRGIYLKMLATDIAAPFNENDSDSVIFSSIVQRINFVVSRGQPGSFYNYFQQNNLGGYFNNATVQENGNATIFFDVPIPNTPLTVPNPFTVFSENMFRLKAAGIKIIVNSTLNIPLFQLADLNGNVAPGNAGFAGLNSFGEPEGGGFYAPTP